MTQTPDEAKAPQRPAPPAVPNFREDERVLARYDSMIQRRIKDFHSDQINSIRRNAAAKADGMRGAIDEAQAEFEKRKAVFDVARDAYGKLYPAHVKKTRIDEPSAFENMRSLGAANKLYKAANDAWLAMEDATGNIRRIELNESQVGIELERALDMAPQLAKEVTESKEWLAEIHAEEELASVKTKVDAILAERSAYEKRLAAGTVSDEEIRLRAFALADVKHLVLPITQFIFSRIETFGTKAYFILRDSRKTYYSLPYDTRLEPLLNGVYDINRSGKSFEVKRTTKDNGLPMTLLEHFMKCNDNKDTEAQEAYRAFTEFVKTKRTYASNKECDGIEIAAIVLLSSFAAAKAVRHEVTLGYRDYSPARSSAARSFDL